RRSPSPPSRCRPPHSRRPPSGPPYLHSYRCSVRTSGLCEILVCTGKHIQFVASNKYIAFVTEIAPLTPQEEAAWRALARAVLVIPRVLDAELLESQGLNLTEYNVLMNLSEHPDRSMRMSELANAVSISISGLTRVVERLSHQGLVERVKAETDGRGQLAVLTPAGLARLEKAYPTHLAGVRKHVMDHLANLDLATLAEALANIAAA